MNDRLAEKGDEESLKMQEELENLRSKNESLKGRINDLESQLEESKSKIMDLFKKGEDPQGNVGEYSKELLDRQNKLDDKLKQLQEENSELDQISKYLDTEMKQVKIQLRNTNNQKKTKLENLRKEIERSKSEQLYSFGSLKEMITGHKVEL